MSGRSVLGAGFWLGFESVERSLENLTKHAAESWPPYNVEQIGSDQLQVTLAVAGFAPSELKVVLDQNHLVIQGKKSDENASDAPAARIFLYRGIASRQFQRHFILGNDIRLDRAELSQGLLVLSLSRPPPPCPQYVTITTRSKNGDDQVALTITRPD
ncbi:MAG: Hsp20 family protein [Candidatus Symbiobacter sp.]|nr:Hsp20 family protein [Candidatus Symbiobacter sp.]